MKKYIIKNCPALLRMSKVCDDFSGSRCTARPCKDITDCLMKQIVENLKTCLQDNTCNNCDGIGYYDGFADYDSEDFCCEQECKSGIKQWLESESEE